MYKESVNLHVHCMYTYYLIYFFVLLFNGYTVEVAMSQYFES